MSIFDQYRNSKQFWIITVLVIILVACLAVLGFLMATKPAGPADAGPRFRSWDKSEAKRS